MKITFGANKNKTTFEINRRIGLTMMIHLNHLDALAREENREQRELNDSLCYCLGQANVAEACGAIDRTTYALFVDEIYRTYHGEGTTTYEDSYHFD